VKRCRVLVEGTTEEVFVNRTLRPHLLQRQFIDVQPVQVETSRLKGGGKLAGGSTNWASLDRQLRLHCQDGSALITTMFDFYAFPSVPGFTPNPNNPRQAVEALHERMSALINASNFVPFVMLHEFEALLYVDPKLVASYAGDPKIEGLLSRDVQGSGEPELIDSGPQSAPSKRIRKYWPRYAKGTDGPAIASEVGLPHLRAECPHLDRWVSTLEMWDE
jgi:Domain of unknown function (DUF4276)